MEGGAMVSSGNSATVVGRRCDEWMWRRVEGDIAEIEVKVKLG